ncbi:MAG TPA: alpha/beta hydrolase [Chitinophagaceae bacterium]|nr:alpha/beta hydrolase [Chitinophagaceae bacterium]
MKHIYCISGFGADERMFSKFQFTGYEIHFIKWITPEKNENIQSYTKRLIKQIHHETPIFIGLSFGGMICVEIASQINTSLIIIISSIKSHAEMPLWMRLSGKLKLNRLLPMRSYKLIQPLQDYNLGIQSKEERKLVHSYRKNIDKVYSNWAVNAILNWKNTVAPKNLYHIHGDQDRIFSIKKIKSDYTISKGGHLMILNKSEEVNECISSILRKYYDC